MCVYVDVCVFCLKKNFSMFYKLKFSNVETAALGTFTD